MNLEIFYKNIIRNKNLTPKNDIKYFLEGSGTAAGQQRDSVGHQRDSGPIWFYISRWIPYEKGDSSLEIILQTYIIKKNKETQLNIKIVI